MLFMLAASVKKKNHRHVIIIIIRGGIEDTRLEAKAKDTEKFRGQG